MDKPYKTHGYGFTSQNPSLHYQFSHCNHGSVFSMKWWGPSFSMGARIIQISGGIWSKFGCISPKIIKWRGHPLPSMVFDNPWFCSMVWLQGKLCLSHPWYLTTHGFGPWYGPKEHCNNVIKRPYAFSIKHLRNFGILHWVLLFCVNLFELLVNIF